MTGSLTELKATASVLPPNERAALAHFLIQSLDEDNDEKTNFSEEWAVLAHKRIQEMDAGNVTGIPAEDVLRNLLKK